MAAQINSPNLLFCPVDVTKPEDVEAALAETKVPGADMLTSVFDN